MPSPLGSPAVIDVGIKGGLITGGLGRPACQGIITMLPFQLGCFIIVPPPPIVPPKPTNEGGSIPLEPGEIHDFYQPVDSGTLEGEFVDPRVYGKRLVKLKIISPFFEGEKEYLISERRAKYIIKAMNIANVTRERMNVMASNIKTVATRAKVWIKNFNWRIKP